MAGKGEQRQLAGASGGRHLTQTERIVARLQGEQPLRPVRVAEDVDALSFDDKEPVPGGAQSEHSARKGELQHEGLQVVVPDEDGVVGEFGPRAAGHQRYQIGSVEELGEADCADAVGCDVQLCNERLHVEDGQRGGGAGGEKVALLVDRQGEHLLRGGHS